MTYPPKQTLVRVKGVTINITPGHRQKRAVLGKPESTVPLALKQLLLLQPFLQIRKLRLILRTGIP